MVVFLKMHDPVLTSLALLNEGTAWANVTSNNVCENPQKNIGLWCLIIISLLMDSSVKEIESCKTLDEKYACRVV